jgi:DNA polymerase III delta subunit
MYLVKYQNIATYKEIGISENQYRYLLNKTNYSEQFLRAAISFLADIDFRLKSGRLELAKDNLMDYIIARILSLK